MVVTTIMLVQMSVVVESEIKQTKPFASKEEAAYIAILLTAERLRSRDLPMFKDADLTPSQYNVLRILRGSGEAGISCSEISERMITRDPDMTRMLDRLEKRGFITRERQVDDRRIVKAFVSKRGLKLLEKLDGPIASSHKRQLGHMTEKELTKLMKLLDKARNVAKVKD